MDAVDTLVQRRRFEDALWLCEHTLSRMNPGEIDHARWRSKHALVVAEQTATELFSYQVAEMIQRLDADSDRVCEPIETLRRSYPNSDAAPFLSATQLRIRQRLLRAVIIAASVSPVEDADRDDLLRRITRLQGDADRLLQEVRGQRDRLSGLEESGIRAEYQRLSFELTLQRISLAAMQTELFPEGSDDFVTASADAANLTRDAMVAFPDGTAAKRTANYWMAVCLLGSGDYRGADELILAARKMSVVDGADRWLALDIRHALATGNPAHARRLSESFYGSRPLADVPRSNEMDFARLRILLEETDAGDAVADWLDVIEQRGDAFARRRAEAIAISALGPADVPKSPRATNPAIVAARGEALTRRGDWAGGGALLRAAALAEPNAARAFEYATKSAAATLGKDPVSTIDVLHSVAMSHFEDSSAAGVSYSAAVYAAKQVDPETLQSLRDRSLDVRSLLQEIYSTWPNSTTYARRANEWLCEIHYKSGDMKSAAYAASEFLLLETQQSAYERTMTAWFRWLSSLDADAATQELVVVEESLRELFVERPPLQGKIRETAVWLFDQPDAVGGLATSADKIQDTFLRRVAELRRSQPLMLTFDGVDDAVLDRVRWRLIRDGILDPKKQPRLGRVLRDWPEADPWLKARGTLWMEVNAKSIGELTLLGLSKVPGATQRAIEILLETKSDEATRSAVTLADRLASRLPIGSEAWHEWKLKAITWLKQVGQTDEAVKRAKYILLTRPPQDATLKEAYRAFGAVNQPSGQ